MTPPAFTMGAVGCKALGSDVIRQTLKAISIYSGPSDSGSDHRTQVVSGASWVKQWHRSELAPIELIDASLKF